MDISTIADWVTIIMFAISIGSLVIASISKKFRVWIESVINDILNK